ncbi:MAG: hypothetical protein L6R39_006593, partial [Caloplaca ligustica]
MADLPTHTDVLIVGTGIQGLVAAKTYLQLSPRANLLIIDSQHSIGGVWSKENCYPGLKTNNQLGTFEYTDFNIKDACPGKVREGEHIPGEVAYEYLYKYAQHFGLLPRIRLGYKVLTAEHLPHDSHGWRLTLSPTSTERSQSETSPGDFTLTASKLIVSTGLTSTPLPVSLPGSSTFTPPLLNFGEFRSNALALLANPNIEHVVVYGGAKAAYDAVYTFASRSTPENPKRVTWIIRASGHGPVYMAPSHIYLGPLRCWLEPLVTLRPLTWLSPCIWGASDGFAGVRHILHGTRVGRWIVKAFWQKLGGDVVVQTGLRDKGPEVAKLVPKEEAFWYGTGISILNYEKDIHGYVRDGTVKVITADIDHLEGKKVVLKGKEEADVDDVGAMICSTGWRWDSGIKFLPETSHADLGIPSAAYTPAQKTTWADLEARADVEILERFPMLATGPATLKEDIIIPIPTSDRPNEKAEPAQQKKAELTPWRLFRGIAPPAHPHRDLVFLGMMLSLQTMLRSEIAALWAYAYLNDALGPLSPLSTRPHAKSPSDEPKEGKWGDWLYETALFSRFGRWRYPRGYGAR